MFVSAKAGRQCLPTHLPSPKIVYLMAPIIFVAMAKLRQRGSRQKVYKQKSVNKKKEKTEGGHGGVVARKTKLILNWASC